MLFVHQGGWDEMLMVVVPLALVAGLLVLANHRANQEVARRAADDGGEADVDPEAVAPD